MDKIDILKSYFGYDYLKPKQALIIDNILDNKDTIGLLPTGYGKSITFTIPSLILSGMTIVITPLISLMADQVRGLKEKYIKAEYINSLLDYNEIENIYRKIKYNKVKILYIAGERLLNKKFQEAIANIDIDLVVCDEAHTLLWSDDFRYQLKNIKDFIINLKKRPRLLALSATATNNTIEKIKSLMNMSNPSIIKEDSDKKNIYYNIVKTSNKERELLSYLNKIKGKCLIYCLSIKNVIYLYNMLKELKYNVGMYHGALENKYKIDMFNKFISNEINILICTNAFGMGIDIKDIRYVIEYDMPQSIEDFVQQTGRASRDGFMAYTILLFDRKDISMIEYFIDNVENNFLSEKEINSVKLSKYQKLDRMVGLCLSKKCIHKQLSEYFGFENNNECKMCSNCNKIDILEYNKILENKKDVRKK